MSYTDGNNEYFKELNNKLKQHFCISFEDTGYTEEEWISRFGDLALNDAISEYGKKYDLTPLTDLILEQKKGQQLLPQSASVATRET